MSAQPKQSENHSPLSIARKLVAAGISVLPVGLDGKKRPYFAMLPQVERDGKMVGSWDEFKSHPPTDDDLATWFGGKKPAAIGVIGGKVSGQLECLDFDHDSATNYPAWRELVELYQEGLVAKLTLHRSPAGLHHWYRCPEVEMPKTQELAVDPQVGNRGEVLIETRGEGGYAIAPGSPLAAHPSRLPYLHIDGPPLHQVPAITAAEREILLDAARTFDRRPASKAPVETARAEGLKPGQDYNLRGPDWPALLPAGWKFLRQRGRVWLLERPGKDKGAVSATLGFRNCPLGTPQLYCFSSSAHPIPQGRFLDKFGLYALLSHQNDYQAAARALAKEGYGSKPAKKKEPKDKPPSVATQLVELALQSHPDLFRTSEKQFYATIELDGHLETLSLTNGDFAHWLTGRYWKMTKSPVGAQALTEAIATLQAQARFDGECREVYLRIADAEGRMYLDLCNANGNTVEIDANGWRLVAKPPVRFRRTGNMKALPEPVRGGRLDDLRHFFNFESEEGWLLTVAFLTSCIAPQKKHPLLVLQGEQGSAKSTAALICKELIDPNVPHTIGVPNDEQNLFLAARQHALLAIDNLSRLEQGVSDALCRISDNGGFSKRQLHTDGELYAFELKRPVLLTGITDFVTSPDLLDRSLIVRLQTINEQTRVDEDEFWATFQSFKPRILGALLDAIAAGLAELPRVELTLRPRMARFAKWGEAVWRAQGLPAGRFVGLMMSNREEANANARDNSELACAIIKWIAEVGRVEGTPTEVLERLNARVGERVTSRRTWPGAANKFTGQLKVLAPLLRGAGIEWSLGKSGGSGSSRSLVIYDSKKVSSPSSPSPDDLPNS